MTTIAPLPTPPARTQDAATFITNADNFMAALPVFAAQTSAVGTEVNTNATIAATAASSATSSALAAAQSAGVIAWVSGTTYAIGDSRYSPITYQSYRRKTVGAGTTDPSADGTNWALIVQFGEAFSNSVSIAATASLTTTNLGQLSKVTTAGGIITLPPIASAPAGSTISLIAQFATGSSIVKGSASESIVTPAGTSFNSLPLNAGDQVQYVSNGVSWDEAYSCAPVMPATGLRNRIINGAMLIDLRNNGVATGLNAAYTLDRWKAQSGSNLGTVQRISSTLPGFVYALKYVSSGANTFAQIGQQIEYLNCYDLQSQTVTISFYAKANNSNVGSTALSVTTRTVAGVDGAALFTGAAVTSALNITTSPARYSVTRSLGVFGALSLEFILAAHVSGDGFELTGVQIELGSVATTFEQLPWSLELFLCSWYYDVMNYQVNSGWTSANSMGNVLTHAMRVTPTIGPVTFNSGTGATFLPVTNRLVVQSAAHSINQGAATIPLSAEF